MGASARYVVCSASPGWLMTERGAKLCVPFGSRRILWDFQHNFKFEKSWHRNVVMVMPVALL